MELSWKRMLLLHSFLAATKVTGDGLLVGWSTISSRAVFTLATRSFSVSSVGAVLVSILLVRMSSCLSMLIPLAITSACSMLVKFCTAAA